MITVYPFASGSLYTASYALTSSYAISGSLIAYTISASSAGMVQNPQSGSNGKNICLLTIEQYYLLSGSASRVETCIFTWVIYDDSIYSVGYSR